MCHLRLVNVILVESHFASVENNILSDIRNFHMKMIQAKVENTTEIVEPETNQDQYLISSFVPERRRWSSKVITFISGQYDIDLISTPGRGRVVRGAGS